MKSCASANDSSFFFEPESSAALGFGFRCGFFLGLPLHMEIIQERLEREFNLQSHHHRPWRPLPLQDHQDRRRKELIEVDNPSRWPGSKNEIAKVNEPVILATILTNEEYVGGILALVEEKRGKQKTFEYVSSSRAVMPCTTRASTSTKSFSTSTIASKSVSARLRLGSTTTSPTGGIRRW